MKWRRRLFFLWNYWLPFFGAGIKILQISSDFRQIKVRLKLKWWNCNYVGTQYGGSLFSMTDPFYMVMLIENLGPGFVVWDKSSNIRYLRPGKSDVFANFVLNESDFKIIHEELQKSHKMEWQKQIEIKDKHEQVIAVVDKVISIKKKS